MKTRETTTAIKWLMALALGLVLFPRESFAPIVELRAGSNPGDQKESASPTALPVDRQLARWVRQAEEAFEDRNWPILIDRAQRVLEAQSDSLVPVSENEHRSARQAALDLLRRLPPDARALYEAQYEALANRQLTEAKQARDLVLLGQVASRYPLTRSGWDAAEFLGTALLEEGKLALASRVFQTLVEHPDFGTRGSPQILLKLAAARAGTGDRVLAEKTLEEVRAKFPGTVLEAGGDQTTASQFLGSLVPLGRQGTGSSVSDWSAFLGGSKRNLVAEGSVPLLVPEWSRPISQDVGFDVARWESYLRARQRYDPRSVPGVYPLAQGGRVFAKTLDGLLALDLETGEVRWKAVPWSGGSASYMARVLGAQSHDPALKQIAGGFYGALQQVLFEDTIEFSLAYGDRRVFCVDRVYPRLEESTNTTGQVVFGAPSQNVQPHYNALSAYDASNGKLLWRVSGEAGLRRNLEDYYGVFFLGAPIVIDGQLLILGDRSGETALFLLDTKTGLKTGEISLCVAPRPANTLPHRQRDACPISVSDGIAFCPTQYGRLFAIDLISRRILWNYEYAHTLTNLSSRSHYQRPQAAGPRPQVSAPIAAGHLVVFVPTDSSAVYALNRATGKKLWEVAIDKGNYLAAVHAGKVVLAGEKMMALDLETGRQLWTAEPGRPIGRGVVVKDQYVLPVSGKRLMQVSLKDGKATHCARVPILSSPRAVESERLALPEPWKFTIVKLSGEEWTGLGFDDRGWRSIRLESGGWDKLGYRNYRGTACYRLKLRPPKVPEGQRLYLHCDGIRGQASFFLNGRQVGVHHSGPEQTARLDLTDTARPGSDNVLAIDVHSPSSPGGLTAQPYLCLKQRSLELRELGNLIVCEDRLISTSGDGIEAFPMADTVMRALQARIEREGETPRNLLRRAKIRLSRGDPAEAIQDLRKARPLEADVTLKGELRAALVQALMDLDRDSKDKDRKYLFEARKLAATREERRLVLQQLLEHYQDSGRIVEAIKAAKEMANLVTDGMVDVGGQVELRTRSDRWLAGKILDIWQSAPKEHSEKLSADFGAELAKLNQDDETQVRAFLKVYGELPDTAPVWLKLAEGLVSGERWPEAENILLRFAKDDRRPVAARALWGLVKVSRHLGLDEDADYFVRVLQAGYEKETLPDGQLVSAATQALRKELKVPGQGAELHALRPVKKVEITISNTAPSMYYYPMMTHGTWLPSYRGGQVANDRNTALRVLTSNGEWRVQLPPNQGRYRGNVFGMPMALGFSGYAGQSVFAVGHQIYFAINWHLFAALPAKRQVVWKRSMQTDWRIGGAPLIGSGKWNYVHYQAGGIIRVQQGHYNMHQRRYSMLLYANPRCLLLYDANEFAALDPLKNELLWRRALDCPNGTEVYLTENHLYEILPDGKLRAYRLSDGKKVGEKNIANLRSRPGLYYQGRYVSAVVKGSQAELSSTDPYLGTISWKATAPARATYFRVDDGELGIFEPNGRLQVLALDSGLKTLEAKAPSLGGLPSSMLYGWSTPSMVFVMVPKGRTGGSNLHYFSNARQVQHHSNQYQVNGEIHCFERRSGKFLWKQNFTNTTMFRSAGAESPAIPFMRRTRKQIKQGKQTRSVNGFELQVVDALTGKILAQHKDEQGGYAYQMFEQKGSLVLRTNTGSITVRYELEPPAEAPKPEQPEKAPATPPKQEEKKP